MAVSTEQKVGVVGGGKFGLALANSLSEDVSVLIYSRRTELIDEINNDHIYKGIKLSKRIKGTTDIEEICGSCQILLPVISSVHFKKVMQKFAPHLSPQHMVIHGTKGFDVLPGELEPGYVYEGFRRRDVNTMSEVIKQETDVIRVGALCGPNLSSEILEGLPTATVIASEFDEVINAGREVLSGKRFFVFGSYDMRAAELTGALKNVIALASGVLGGKKLGKNLEAMLIVRGLREMVLLGDLMGSSTRGFFGTAGIGDLIATATSDKSRNYRCGWRIARGDKIQDILDTMEEVVEGIRSLHIAHYLVNKFELHAPIINTIHKIIFDEKDIEDSILTLMELPMAADVDFV